MDQQTKEYIVSAVKGRLGIAQDNLHRAKSAFRNLTQDELGKQYGQSGETCQQIIDGYQASVDEANKALEALR